MNIVLIHRTDASQCPLRTSEGDGRPEPRNGRPEIREEERRRSVRYQAGSGQQSPATASGPSGDYLGEVGSF
jgi:hypothetical protein